MLLFIMLILQDFRYLPRLFRSLDPPYMLPMSLSGAYPTLPRFFSVSLEKVFEESVKYFSDFRISYWREI